MTPSLHRLATLLFLFGLTATAARAQDTNDQLEQAMKDAVRKVAPSVVQIVTQGGSDLVVPSSKGPVFRKALGPTTGVIVGSDGYVISSAFNFINNPTNILVSVPGQAEPYVAKKVATDRSKMLTLLKIDKDGLPVPISVSLKDVHEGQWSIALGRTLDLRRDAPPTVSLGVISALGRIWGKAIQTDAKISPINYGGPIIDIQGRVQGILVPASPQGSDETAGFEWYDSGIGFAIPFEDVLAALPRLKQGKDLRRGILGVRMKSADMLTAAVEIGDVTRDSGAGKAGLKAGDVIIEIDGQPVARMNQVLHILGRKYEGDRISLKYRRGTEVVTVKDIQLIGALESLVQPFLGIVPMRDDPRAGVEIRYVYPKSPAEKAGLKAGDRIVKIGVDRKMAAFTGPKFARDQFIDYLNMLSPGMDVQLEIVRKGGKEETVNATLDSLAQELPIPDKMPEKASLEKARAPFEKNKQPAPPAPAPKKEKTGVIRRTTPTGEHKYWLYVPDSYDPNISHALLVWLHPPGQNQDKDVDAFTDTWADYCEEHHIILLGPLTDNQNGWVPGQADFVVEAVRDTVDRYTIDRQRIVAHGLGVGGQMALYLGFNRRDLFRGVAAAGAVVVNPKENVKNERLSFYLAGGALDPLAKNIAESRTKLLNMKFPVFFRSIPNRGREYLEEAQLTELAHWIDSLDRQ